MDLSSDLSDAGDLGGLEMSLITGSVDLEGLPPSPSNTVKLYLSATATDTVTEREVLYHTVFPELRAFCRQNLGLEFQVVDLRWGQQEEWPDGSLDRMLYWRMIHECQQQSAGPSFMAFLGQRYGHCPVASCIPELDFELITQALRKNRSRETRDASLLHTCYWRDDNCVPPVYRLHKPDKELIPNPTQPSVVGAGEWLTWQETKAAIRRLLTKGVEFCIQEGSIDEADRLQYTMSDLERELLAGINGSCDPANSCLVFMRRITDLNNYVSCKQAAGFLEVSLGPGGQQLPQKEMQDLQEQLVYNKLPEILPHNNIHQFDVLWKYDNGIDKKLHEEYLDDMSHCVKQSLLITLNNVMNNKNKHTSPALVEEIKQHWTLAKSKVSQFCRQVRSEHMEIIHNYLISNSSKPLVLHGEPGSGKTSLMCQVAVLVQDWIADDSIVVLRLLGTTPSCQDLRQLLSSICHQLALVLGHQLTDIPLAFKELLQYFTELLGNIPSKYSVVILLDALQELLPDYFAWQLSWLPQQLTENVKIIVSTPPEKCGLLERLRQDIVKDESHFLEVAAFSHYDAFYVLDEWLAHDHRALTTDQRKCLENTFRECSLPHYLRLVYEDTRTWTSFDSTETIMFANNLHGLVSDHFKRLENQHGSKLVSRALAYLTASRNGLSDNEMMDILSLDNEVMQEVCRHNCVIQNRIPCIYWHKLKVALERYLVQRTCEDRDLNCWNHDLPRKVAEDRYHGDTSELEKVHSQLADYFLGSWHRKKKPYICGNKQKQMYRDCLVPSQPLTFHTSAGSVRFNKRLFGEVPCHLCRSSRFQEVNDLVLFNYDWLYNKSRALSLEHVLSDFALNPGVEATLVESALRQAQVFLLANPDSLATELSGRLLAYYNSHTLIQRLLQGCDRMGLQQCALIPNFPYHQMPGSALKHTLECKLTPHALTLVGNDSRYLMVKNNDSRTIEMFDLVTGEFERCIQTSKGEMKVSPCGRYIIILNTETEKAIKIHDLKTGAFLGQLIPLNHVKPECKSLYKLDCLSLSNQHLCLTFSTDISYLLVADLQQGNFQGVRGLQGRANICQITPDGRFVFTNSNNALLCYNLASWEQTCNSPMEHAPRHFICRQDSQMAFLSNELENKLYVLHLKEGTLDLMYKVLLLQYFNDDSIMNLKLAPNQDLLLVQGRHNLVIYHVCTERVLCHIERPAQLLHEFKLPRGDYSDINFTQASFSADSKFVLGAIFRHIYVWHAGNGRLLSSLQAPVGVLKKLLVPKPGGQVISQLVDSTQLHVWGLADAIAHVETPDRLTAAIEKTVISADNRTAFVQCAKSDEIGVVDMRDGMLQDLLTHSASVHSFSPTADGQHLFVATHSNRTNTANKIWYIKKRQIIYEFGDSPAYNIPLQLENTIISVKQEQNIYNAPFKISLYSLVKESFEEVCVPQTVRYILEVPFVTPQDKYLVVLTAEDYRHECALHVNPTIMAVSLKASLTVSMFGNRELQDVVALRRILHVRPIPNNSYTVLVLFTNEPDSLSQPSRPPSSSYQHCYAFLIFDICSGVICQVIDDFLAPCTPLKEILFTQDVSLCVDHESNVFDMGTGYFLKTLHPDGLRPRHLALHGKVALFYKQDHVYAVRISDGHVMATVNTHGEISCLQLAHDQRTLVVGCSDGALLSYVLIDSQHEDHEPVLASLLSRQPEPQQDSEPAASRSCWDGGKPYSRPPSTHNRGHSERRALSRLGHVSRPSSSVSLMGNNTSRACIVM